MDYPSVLTQSRCETLLQESRAYAENDQHEEDMGHIQSV
jgi:hypothetical protein